jgi:hypothetical protein
VRSNSLKPDPMPTYQATVTREDGWWMVHVPAIDGLTQARRLADAPTMARELVASPSTSR